jgi:hypothetical protein
MSSNITVNVNGVNAILPKKKIARIYCGYGDSASETGGVQNQWAPFSYPTNGIDVYRVHDWEVVPGLVAFKYTGTEPKWFCISATCNVKKGAGGSTSRIIEYQWYLNGSPVGGVRQSHMNAKDSEIVTGEGQLFLSQNDVIAPHLRNVENNDTAILWNCSFNVREDYDGTWF